MWANTDRLAAIIALGVGKMLIFFLSVQILGWGICSDDGELWTLDDLNQGTLKGMIALPLGEIIKIVIYQMAKSIFLVL